MNSYAMRFRIFLFVIVAVACSGIVTAQEKIELKNAKELTGKIVDGQNVREAKGDVEFVQGNVKVYCNNAIQYITSNMVELTGNVKIYQDTLTLLTNKAVYYGDERRAVCSGNVTLKDPNATLRSDNGVYTFSDAKAFFKGDVIIINPDYRITSEELVYFRNTEESYAKGDVVVVTDSAIVRADEIDFYSREGRTFARGNVRIDSDSTIITSDTAVSYSNERRSIAYGKVEINSPGNNSRLFGKWLENYGSKKITTLVGDAFLIQVEENGKDTTFIVCDTMIAFRDSLEKYVASGNVEMIRGRFLSKSGEAVYFRNSGIVVLLREPIVWQDELQLTADSIYAEFPDKKLKKIIAKRIPEVRNSKLSFAISKNTDIRYSQRYDQISGRIITLNFEDEKITAAEVEGEARSIYFMYEDQSASGMNRIEGMKLFIYFDGDQKVTRIKVTGGPKGDYIPEQLIGSYEQLLPGFLLRDDIPERKADGAF